MLSDTKLNNIIKYIYILVITVKWQLYKGLQINIISTVIHNQSTMYKFLYVMVSDALDGQKKLNFWLLTSTVSRPVEVKKNERVKKHKAHKGLFINTRQLTISRYVSTTPVPNTTRTIYNHSPSGY